jgi:poly-gamma-glutamate system protein
MSNAFSTLYWRPQKASRRLLSVIAVVSVTGLAYVQLSMVADSDRNSDRMAAAQRAQSYMDAIKQKRISLGHELDLRFDPHQTGMIGLPDSLVTSKPANLSAKQISVHPDFAAAIVDMLIDAGVRRGDTVAIGWSGSFPALNTCLCAAIETLDLQPVAVASAMSSQYGANMEDFVWLDMEKHLADSGYIRFRSAAMTIGGARDRAFRSSEETLQPILAAQQRTGVEWLEADRLRDSIDARMALYRNHSPNGKAAAYINVGGGVASMGGNRSDGILRSGLSSSRLENEMRDCVANRFSNAGVPVIHLAKVRTLSTNYHINANETVPHVAGESDIYRIAQPSRFTAGCVLLAVIGMMYSFVLRDHGYRIIDMLSVRLRWQPKPTFRIVNETDQAISQLMV